MMSLYDTYKNTIDQRIADLKVVDEYNPKHIGEELLFNSYILITELLDPSNSYEYTSTIKGMYEYTDMQNVKYGVRITYNVPMVGDGFDTPYFEFKTWFETENGKRLYNGDSGRSTSMDLDIRSNTVAKIFRDEIVPFFSNQNISNLLVFKPVDQFRYRLARMLVNKYKLSEWEVEEHHPKLLIVRKFDELESTE